MSFVPGTRLGPYEITGPLGAGGMGEVYRATDTNLKRAVAIKVLPDAVATDRERLARFQREAELLARLNHPNIAAIYGLEKSDGTAALVMELVEGPTLADRIAQGPMPVEDALPTAKQIAEALEAAHELGIVHRDLKPANVKVRPDGMVKVLDFGLAKALEPSAAGNTDATASPTITSPAMMTRMGVILGTAAYMAPEQARGRSIDKRADVWALGCVLYEMLAGRPPFGGEDVAEIIGAVIHKDPDWTALPANTPTNVRTLLRRCLQKDRRNRIPDAGTVRIELQETVDGSLPDVPPSAAAISGSRVRLAWSLAAIMSIATAALAMLLWFRQTPADTQVYRASILQLDEAPIGGIAPGRFALSPDGRHLVFRAQRAVGPPTLWLRSLESGTARQLPGTDGASAQFWSPDSRFVAFAAQGRLQKIDISGGPPIPLANVALPGVGAGSWNNDNVILFPTMGSGGLYRLAAAGGSEPVPVTTLDTAAGDSRHWWPEFLPDGKHFLYEAIGTTASADEPRAVYLASLDEAGSGRLLLNGGSNAKYAQGYILFMLGRTLMARPFDAERLEFTGEPVPVADQVDIGGSTGQSGAFSVSETGVLVYQTGGANARSQIVWLDRSGKQTGVVQEGADFGDLELSPDETRLVVSLPSADRTRDIWVIDLSQGNRLPFTRGSREESAAVWSPDGSRLAFSGGRRVDAMDLFVKPANGAGSEEVLLSDSHAKFPTSWSRDSRFLLYETAGPNGDVWVLPLAGDRQPQPFMQTAFNEVGAHFSPNGRWIAYGSNETGRGEIFVAAFPQTGFKKLISKGGAVMRSARWSRDGRELFYVEPGPTLMVAPVDGRGAEIKAETARPLFPFTPAERNAGLGNQYDVSPKRQRFLVNVTSVDRPPQPLTLVVNWTAALPGR